MSKKRSSSAQPLIHLANLKEIPYIFSRKFSVRVEIRVGSSNSNLKASQGHHTPELQL